METKEERQKPLLNESAPNNGGRTMQDPTALNNWSDVEAAPVLEVGRLKLRSHTTRD
jgi:hypothetical protein